MEPVIRSRSFLVMAVLVLWAPGGAPWCAAAAPAAPDASRPSLQQDVVYFRNGDRLRGRVLNKALRIYTPYALVRVPLPACAELSFPGAEEGAGTLTTVNHNRLTGDLVDRTVRFRPWLSAESWEIRRERVLRIVFGREAETKRPAGGPARTDLFVMGSGDLLTGRPEQAAFRMAAGRRERKVPFADVRSLQMLPAAVGSRVRVITRAAEVVQGALLTEAISLKLDFGGGIEPFYLDQCAAVYRDDGSRLAAERVRAAPAAEPGEGRPRAGDAGNPDVLVNSLGMKLRRIEPHAFVMGSARGNADESPPHRVVITEPFYVGVLEVTQGQWEAVMGANPSHFPDPLRPVEGVSWDDARLFCRRLSQREKRTYRLPTEAEWEAACRAGTSTAYPWGDAFREDHAWCAVNAGGSTRASGTREPNRWGLHDMIGNVWEWVEDAYAPYPGGVLPGGAAGGSARVLRGGAWYNVPESCRAASRMSQPPGYRASSTSGFRVAAEP